MRKQILLYFLFLLIFRNGFSQCDPSVPLYTIDLSNNPDTTWTLFEADALDRQGQCCSATSNENCIQFEITLHPNTAGVFFDYDGAGAYGSLNWQIDCGPEYNLKDTICYTGTGTFTLTFCKPGSDNGNYTLISVPQPTFPEDQFVPLNCVRPVEVLGVTENSVQWQSISPGPPGAYDTLLSCTNCLEPVYTPGPNGPIEVEFQVCGYPILDYCVGNFDFCDTVKFTSLDSILIDVTPSNPSFCSGGNVDLIASATGGDGNFEYYWYDNALNLVFVGDTFNVSTPGSYTCNARDGNYEPGNCEIFTPNITVVETVPPVVSISSDQVLCANVPDAEINYSVVNATGSVWSGGAGSFTDVNDSTVIYSPTQSEIASGSVELWLKSTGAGSSCDNDSSSIQLFYLDTIQTDLTDITLGCFGSSTTVNPVVTGGTGNYTSYSWTDGTATLSNDLGSGTHCLTITDDNGCQATECFTITTPSELNLTVSSTPATTDGGSDGTATANPSGGVSPYTYLWSTSGTSQTETGLSYGIYTVTVTDDNGCTRTASVVVNEPQCAGFSVSTSTTDILCNGDSTGTATVVPSGGTPTYSYSWNDYSAQTTATATNLHTGVYEVTVTDANGCFAVGTASVFEPSALLNTMSHTDVTVQGGSDGTAQVNATGGAGSYSYLWSTSETSANIAALSTGWYDVEITDANSCTLIDSVFINEPPCDQFYIYVSTVSPLCNGDLTGEAMLTIQNGIGPYTIDWSTGENNVYSISNVAGGIHSVEVTDAQGCYTFLNYGVSEPSPLSIGLLPTPSTCTGYNNGTIDMSISGGTYPYYYYNWSNGATTEDVINLAPGSYSITVTDENGCQASSNTTLVDPLPLSFTYTTQDVTCFNGTDGSIDITPSGGTLPYTYTWSNGVTTQDQAGIDVGGYILNITDGNFCDFDEPVTLLVEQPEKVEADTIIVNCPSPGAAQAQINISPIGGTGNYAISTDGGSTYGPYGNYSYMMDIGQGYDIVIKDVNNCTSDIYHIDIDPAVVIDDILYNLCYSPGQTDESITVNVSGGTADYSISTDNGISFGSAGNYTMDLPINSSYQVVAMDENGCVSLPFAITLPDVFDMTIAVTSNFNGQDVSCNGSSDGETTATVTGGAGGYVYSWSNGSMSAINQNLIAGNYSLTVEDANGCTINDNITIAEPAALGQSISSPTFASGSNISCNGLNDGAIDYAVSGGTPGYSFSWTTLDGSGLNVSSEDQSNLTAGTYTVTVVDVNGCSIGTSITLTEDDLMSQNISAPTFPGGDHISCFGETDGSIDYTVNGGSTPYAYVWNTADGSGLNPGAADQSGLSAGTYNVVVTDENGCSLNTSITLTEPTQLVQSIVSPTYPNGDNISCNGLSDGSIDYSVNGGSPTYTYSWDSGQSTQDLTDIPEGTYNVTVTDLNGCTLSTSITLTEPPALSQNIFSPTYASGSNISCNGMNDGSIDYTVSGGSPNYNFNWTTTDGSGLNITSEDQSGLTAGTYDVTVTDINGCSASNSITLTEQNLMFQNISSATFASGDNISCNGFSDGSIDYNVTGGSTPYIFDWSTSDGSGLTLGAEDQSGLSAGTYNVTATDQNGCSLTSTIVLSEPTALAQGLNASTYPSGNNISCNGLSDGAIDYSISGGSGSYSFSWSSGQATEDIVDITSGTYTVITTDLNGCTIDTTVTLTEPTVLDNSISVVSDYNGQDISCYGETDGSVEIIPTGGSSPYTYAWSDGQTTFTAVDLGIGNYSVVVTDVNGCTTSNTITLTGPDTLSISTIVVDVSCNGGNDGAIDITPGGGTQPYSFQWSNGEVTEDIVNLSAGTYVVVLTDVNNCNYTTGDIVVEPTTIDLSVNTTDASCFNYSDGAVDLSVTGGTPPYSYLWSEGQTTEDIQNLPAGSYTVTVTDDNGCYTDISGVVDHPDSLVVTGEVTNSTCFEAENGAVDITVAGGTVPYSFNWNCGETTEDISDMFDGTHVVNITDANGCTQTGSYVITQPDSLEVLVSSPLNFHGHNIDLYGGNDGVIYSTVNGGTGPYYYDWSNGEVTEVLYSCSAGTYSVEVEDSMGCKAVALIVLTQPMNLDLPSAFSPNNDNANDKYVIRGIEAYPDNRFIVTNRWGNVVYEKEGYANTWGGENKQGNILPDGVYFVILEINGGDIKRDTYVHIKTH